MHGPDEAAYLEPRGGETWPLDRSRWRAPDGGTLLVTPLPGIAREDIDPGARGMWRYAAAMPLPIADPVSLGEGGTPLLRHAMHGADVWLKCDWLTPTGSYKDRGASILVSALRHWGVGAIRVDSSGNAAAAFAAYAAAAGMTITVFAPEGGSAAKLLQARAYGAEIRLVGDRATAGVAARNEAEPGEYAGHAWHPLFLHGTKTLAYEVWEELDARAPRAVPDNVIVPCGAGTILLGLEIGFAELHRAGLIETPPRLFAAQPAACAPVAAHFLAPPGEAPVFATGPTMAEGASIADPPRLREMLGALRATGGGAVMLDETEIADATRALAHAGFFVEPTGALGPAALARLMASGAITPDQTTVIVLTGTGLKTPARMAALFDAG